MTDSTMSREDIIRALSELVRFLKVSNSRVEIRIVGGAALALRYLERQATRDIDSLAFKTDENEAVVAAIQAVAEKLSLPPDWLNTEVTKVDAFPTMGKDVEWETIFNESGVQILIPVAEVLLVMKLKANRPGRDTPDIRGLLNQLEFKTLASIEALYESYYPGEVLPERAAGTAVRILEEHESYFSNPPGPPKFNIH